MRFRKLRIAWSVAWGVACLALIMLWVESRHRRVMLEGTALQHVFAIEATDGEIGFDSYYLNPAYTRTPWSLQSYGPKSAEFGERLSANILLRDAPLIALFAFLAAAPWAHLIKLGSSPRLARSVQ